MDLSEKYWDTRYKIDDIAWDLGQVSPPLKDYFDQLVDKNLKILIPGCGNSYEAEYLFNNGFKNVFVVDVSKTALANLAQRVPNFPKDQLIHQDFFSLNSTFDLIIEQTFFCAINPSLRSTYAKKVESLLVPDGKLVGLLFNAPLNNDKPPFGGNKAEYLNYFNPYFKINTIEEAHNSITPRMGRELFIQFHKK
ncbi:MULTISPECIES: methyltransferase domain-containing protein [Mesoflavibacter]|uniref:TPMT family class I SAM-dependent methyltransferase n=1 Tax=Mesoflavibacter profundi TaxID=2708110 RepID=A0ABT4RX23_9FLAO|nr:MULTISPECIES: methyltransferase domain-containing protein [Mesoflavibacter]MDA0176356.1 TPMT family class I SAM-dependent methyltransferase [Mesoflavibacter profundi]QIJ89996.1 thiopurine S-methyltransferase [Mesoflavibacter sp. HG96]QIJ92724.1 thiopurine S-methyltransferase [Mesoflavibacter sp. HG37]